VTIPHSCPECGGPSPEWLTFCATCAPLYAETPSAAVSQNCPPYARETDIAATDAISPASEPRDRPDVAEPVATGGAA